MNKKLYCLILIYFISGAAFADAITNRNYLSKQNQTQSSRILYTNAGNDYDTDSVQQAVKELQTQIKKNPDDYDIRVSLVDIFLKSKQYDNSYNELVYLYTLSNQNKLNYNVKTHINNILEIYKRQLNYEINKSDLLVNLALISLILKDTNQAENYIYKAAESKGNIELSEKAALLIFDLNSQNAAKSDNSADIQAANEKAINVFDKILMRNNNSIDIRKLKAQYCVLQKNYDGAINEYSKILDINPDDIDTKYNLYKLLSAKKMSEKEIIKRIYKTDTPDYAAAYYEIAEILLKNNNLTEAKDYANALIGKFPENANGYILLAEIYQKEGRLKDSYDALMQVKDKAESNEAIAKYNVMLAKLSNEPVKEAKSLISSGLYQQALDVLQSASQENLYVILTQAQACYLLNKKQQALELLNKSMSLYPNNSDVYYAFSDMYFNEKDIDTAKKYIKKSLNLNPENKSAMGLYDKINAAESAKYTNDIISTFEAQNYEETNRLINAALEVNKKDYTAYFYKALTYIAQNNYAASTAALYKCIELDKNNPDAYFYLGKAFDNLSEPDNALIYYKKYITMLPADNYGESENLNYANTRIKKLQNQ